MDYFEGVKNLDLFLEVFDHLLGVLHRNSIYLFNPQTQLHLKLDAALINDHVESRVAGELWTNSQPARDS